MFDQVKSKVSGLALLIVLIGVLAPAGALAAPPGNDDLDTAVLAASIPFEHSVQTNEATAADDDPIPVCGNASTARSVWYSIAPTEEMRLEVSTAGSDYDTILSVWQGTRGSLSSVACNDDAQGATSTAYFDASPGSTYYMMVSSFTGNGGAMDLAVARVPENLELLASVDDKAWVNSASGGATITGEVACSEPAPVAVELKVTQRTDEGRRQGFGYLTLDCEGTERWLVQIPGNFRAGDAGVDATAYWTVDSSVRAATSLKVSMRSCTMIGTLGDDTINGDAGNDKICSLAGNDTINGRGGDDQLRGHDGADTIIGGEGNDVLTGGYGTDVLRGSSGKDDLWGDAGPDVLSGGRGTDRCTGGAGADRLVSCEQRR